MNRSQSHSGPTDSVSKSIRNAPGSLRTSARLTPLHCSSPISRYLDLSSGVCREAVTTTGGMPSLKVVQMPPPVVERNTPTSVPAYSTFGSLGSISRALVGIFGKPLEPVPLTFVQLAPVSVVLNTCPDPKTGNCEICDGRIGVVDIDTGDEPVWQT